MTLKDTFELHYGKCILGASFIGTKSLGSAVYEHSFSHYIELFDSLSL